MKTVTKRELNQQTARVLAEVTAGDSLIVTDRGVARWRIERVDAHPDPIERLRSEGRIIPAKKNPRPITTPQTPEAARYTSAQIDAILDEMRQDRDVR